MTENIQKRLIGIQNIIITINYNTNILRYLTFSLHKDKFNIENNKSLFWISSRLIENNLINFHKLFSSSKQEKHTLRKFTNICNQEKIECKNLENEINILEKLYLDSGIKDIRDSYIAHLDINTETKSINFGTIINFTDKLNVFFNKLSLQLEFENVKDFGKINESLNEIFEQIRILEKVNSKCYIEELKGKENINLIEMSEIIKTNNS